MLTLRGVLATLAACAVVASPMLTVQALAYRAPSGREVPRHIRAVEEGVDAYGWPHKITTAEARALSGLVLRYMTPPSLAGSVVCRFPKGTPALSICKGTIRSPGTAGPVKPGLVLSRYKARLKVYEDASWTIAVVA